MGSPVVLLGKTWVYCPRRTVGGAIPKSISGVVKAPLIISGRTLYSEEEKEEGRHTTAEW